MPRVEGCLLSLFQSDTERTKMRSSSFCIFQWAAFKSFSKSWVGSRNIQTHLTNLWAQFIVGRSPSLGHIAEKFIEHVASIVNPRPPVSQLYLVGNSSVCEHLTYLSGLPFFDFTRYCIPAVYASNIISATPVGPSLSFAWETQNHCLFRVL